MSQPYLTRRRFITVNLVLVVLLLASVVGASLIGSVHVDLARALHGGGVDNTDRVILFDTRLPRVLLAAIVGAALATAGVALQGLLRNPLAEPHLIGISGGAAVGAVVAVIAGGRSVMTETWLLPLAAAAGALLSMGVVYRLALVHGRLQPYVLLLAGVVYNAFAGALIMCVNAIADFYQAQGILLWLMGSLATHSYRLVATIGVYTLIGAGWLLLHTRQLNVLSLGEDGAWQLGVDVERTRRATFLAASFLVGAAFLVWADTVARTALGVVELPVGVVTALCGGPFFVYLLKREGRKIFG